MEENVEVSVKKPFYSYDKEELLSLRKTKLSRRWPPELSKKCLTRGGFWDPVQSFKAVFKTREPERELKPKISIIERVRDDRDGIILGPQKRSWDTGCHVAPGKASESVEKGRGGGSLSSTNTSSRRTVQGEFYGRQDGRSSSGSGAYRGNNRFDDYYTQREGSNRFYNSSKSSRDREYGDRERPQRERVDRERNIDRDERDSRDDRGGYRNRENHTKRNPYSRGDRERNEYSYNDRGSGYRHGSNRHQQQATFGNDEPEWMSEGPSNFNETIELCGIREADGMSEFKKQTAMSESSDEEYTVSPELDSKSEAEPTDDFTEKQSTGPDLEVDSTVSTNKGSRFKHLFMPKDSTEEDHTSKVAVESASKERDAQLFDLIKGSTSDSLKPGYNQQTPIKQSTREMEDVIKGLLSKKENSDIKTGNLHLPRGLANGQVKTVDEIEASISTTPKPAPISDGNKGAGDMSAFNKLLGMMTNSGNSYIPPNHLSNPNEATIAASSSISRKVPTSLDSTCVQQPQSTLSNADKAVLMLRQQQMQASRSNATNHDVITSGLHEPRQQSTTSPVGARGAQQSSVSMQMPTNQNVSSHTSGLRSDIFPQQQQSYPHYNQNIRTEQLAYALRAMSNPMASQFPNHYNTNQMGANAFRWLRAMTNAVSASARINQLQCPEGYPGMSSGRSSLLQNTTNIDMSRECADSMTDNRPSALADQFSTSAAMNQQDVYRSVNNSLDSDLSRQFSQKMMGVFDSSPQQQTDMGSKSARPIVKTMQETGPYLQQQRNNPITGRGNAAPVSSTMNHSNFFGSQAYGGAYGSKSANYYGQSLNNPFIMQQLMLQKQLEAKSASYQMQQLRKQKQNLATATAMSFAHPINNSNNSAASIRSNLDVSAGLANLFTGAQDMPPLPNRDDIAVKTLDELEG